MNDVPELWVGPECTVSRVGDSFHDQLEVTGFAARLDDIDRLAWLGAKRVRFPVLWERTELAPGVYDFRWADERLARLRELGIKPIIGLVHHGSGPPHTNLHDPEFPAKLGRFAAAVAMRYPWVDAWTPVNEPLTTARFAGLYGHWHPHHCSDESFVRALLHQVQAVVASMRAVRSVNDSAMLIQTDDVGHTSGTPGLSEQVAFDNERRWLGFDLLCGRVGASHPMWSYLLWAGASREELYRLVSSPTPPDIFGINYYVTSERFLDQRIERYPAHLHGGNGRLAYVDVEAVRVEHASIGGFTARIREMTRRYAAPMAITEVHLGCTREEQLRWFCEAWEAARSMGKDGTPIFAVTAWAAFGTMDWDSLLTRPRGRYEAGLWDIRGTVPRPTALAQLVRKLAAGDRPDSPILQAPGWWRRAIRHQPQASSSHDPEAVSPLLIVGATGTLGQAFGKACMLRGLPYRLARRDEVELSDRASVRAALERWRPWAVVNAAGYVRVDDAESDARQWRDNAIGPVVLAHACSHAGIPSLSFSSDLVFDGESRRPYRERDIPHPLNAYGAAKARAERALARLPRALVVRTSAFFGPWDNHNFLTMGLRRIQSGQTWSAVRDQVVSPTYVPDLVQASLDLLIDDEAGIWHVANRSALSWYEFACIAAEAARLPNHLIVPIAADSLRLPARRPPYSALASERGELAPDLADAIERYAAQSPWREEAIPGLPAPDPLREDELLLRMALAT